MVKISVTIISLKEIQITCHNGIMTAIIGHLILFFITLAILFYADMLILNYLPKVRLDFKAIKLSLSKQV